jgi:monovalent cation/proton antiporter MnhG/PhaG subunit
MVVINILLWIAVAVGLVSALGMVVMKDFYERLHYLAPPSTLSIFLVTVAIGIQEGASQALTKAILSAVALALINPVITHAMARASRIRTYGHWVSQPHEGERQAGD